MSFIPPTTIAVMLSANVVRLFTRRFPAHEQVLNGLTYHAPIPLSDLPTLLEPSPDGYIISESARKKSAQELLAQSRFQRRFQYSNVQDALPLGLRQPWEEIEEQFGGRELGIVSQVLAFSLIAHISVSAIECVQGNPPGISTIPVFFALILAICICLVRRLVAANVVSKTSTNSKTATDIVHQSETFYAFVFSLAFSLVTALFLVYFLFFVEGTTYLGGYLPEASGASSSATLYIAKRSSQELPWLDLGASLSLGIGHFASRMDRAVSLIFNFDTQADASSIIETLEETYILYDSRPSMLTVLGFIGVLSPILGGISALLFSPSRRIGRLSHDLSTEEALKAAGKGQDTFIGVTGYLTYRLWTFLQFFGPLIISLLWIRPMVGYVFVSPLLIRCNPESVSRDCFPIDFVRTTTGVTSVDDSSQSLTGSLFTAPSLTDSQWLQVRISALLLVCVFQIYNLRRIVQLSLKKSELDQADHIATAAIESPVEKVKLAALADAASGKKKNESESSKKSSSTIPISNPMLSGYSSTQLAELTETLFMDQLKAVLSAASVAVLTLSVPALLLGLALLSLRTGGFIGGLGVCSSSRNLLSYGFERIYSTFKFTSSIPSLLPEPGSFPPKRSALELLLDAASGGASGMSSTKSSEGIGMVTEIKNTASISGKHLALIIHTIADALGPSFWRPVLSFSLWWILVTCVLMQEFGYLIARSVLV